MKPINQKQANLISQIRRRAEKTGGEALRQETRQVPQLPRRPRPQKSDRRRRRRRETALLLGRRGAARVRGGQDGHKDGGEGRDLLLQEHLDQGRV